MKKHNRLTKTILLFFLISLIPFNLLPTASAVTIDTTICYICGNENDSINSGTMQFSQIAISNTNVCFNQSYFNVSSGGAIQIKLIKIANNIKTTAAPGDTVLSFTGTATTGTTYFNISGFKASYVYDIYKDTAFAYQRTSSTQGRINFSHSSWSTHTFEVREPLSNNVPVISNEYPTTGSTGIGLLTLTRVTVTDADLNTMTVCFWNNKTGSWVKAQQNNTVASGTVVRDMSAAWDTSYSTKYWWRITCDDETDNTTATYSFTTKANSLPVFSSENPANSTTGVSTALASWSVTINEPNGEAFDWTIQTTPYVGSNSGNAAANGSKSTNLVGMVASTIYKVWVNATDGIGWRRAWYIFTTANPGNNPPSVTLPYPENNTYDIILPLSYFRINVSDPDGNTMNITFNENYTTGSWRTFDSNATVTNGTYYAFNTTWVDAYSTPYYWNVSVNDGMGGWTNKSYLCFSTRNNTDPVLGAPFPANTSTDVDKSLGLLSINISDPEGDLIDAVLQENSSGSWVTFGNLANKENGTYDTICIWITNYSEVYWWKVFANDSYGGSSSAIYHFTTDANTPPAFGTTFPLNNTTGVSTGIYQFTVYISDDEVFDWNISVSPSLDTAVGVNNNSGTKTCLLTGIITSTLYTVSIDATDSLGATSTAVYYFSTASSIPGGGGGGAIPATGILRISIVGEASDIKIYQGTLLRYVKSSVQAGTSYTVSGLAPGEYTVEVTGITSGKMVKKTVTIVSGQTETLMINPSASAIPGFELPLFIMAFSVIVFYVSKRRKLWSKERK